VPLAEPDPLDVEDVLDSGAVGLCLPATALATPAALDRVGPLLERLERRGAPLFVHPGAARGGDVPAWWAAMTDYVNQMHAAWHAFLDRGRAAHPELKVVFAMLAGGAPLHHERLSARGGPNPGVDRGVFYDTSSYGGRMLDAMVRVVGIDQLVHGSDRPVVAPPLAPGPLGPAAWEAMTRQNPARLLRAGVLT
jgi:predicted TIM-barrel fold metal-dependent hydrolase